MTLSFIERLTPKATRGKTAKVINKKRSVGAERQMLFSRCSSEAPPSDRLTDRWLAAT